MKLKLHITLAFTFISFFTFLNAQKLIYKYNDSLNFTNSSNAALIKGLAGGFQCPQFSSCDLNNDGKKDLVVYDRIDGGVVTFINKGAVGEVKYDLDMRYAQYFPKFNAGAWMLMRDYNQDGLEDIFTINGLVYKNTSNTTPGRPSFQILPVLQFRNISSSNSAILFNSLSTPALHLPGIYDVDFDGDIDIMSYTSLGGAITYYKNEQKEMGLPNDSMRFRQVDWCWGNFYDKNCNEFELGVKACNDTNYNKFYSKRHTQGSSITLFDANDDGDIDMVIGNEGCTHLTILNNGKANYNSTYDSIISYDTMFVNAASRAEITLYPASYFIDINNDGKRDLVYAPNSTIYVIQETNQVYWYLNTGTDLAPIFSQKKLLFTLEMLDIGHRSSWAFNDWDKDGDLDAIAASNGDAINTNNLSDRISLFENIGTKNNAILKLRDNNFGSFSTESINNLSVSVADMNADGKLDIVAGNDKGEIKYYRNTSATNNTLSPTFSISNTAFPGFNIDIGNYSSPAIADINKDGLQDLIIGRFDTMLSYYQNIGTANNPDFNLVTNRFGLVKPTDSISFIPIQLKGYDGSDSFDIDGKAVTKGYNIIYERNLFSTPQVLDVNNDGKLELLVGNVLGQLKLYEIGSNPNAKFKQIDSMNYMQLFNNTKQFNVDYGNRVSPAFADLDNNGVPEIIVSCNRGGVQYLKPEFSQKVGIVQPYIIQNINVFPNPAQNEAMINIDQKEIKVVSVFSFDGKEIIMPSKIEDNFLVFNTNSIANGIYFFHLITANNTVYVAKLQVLR